MLVKILLTALAFIGIIIGVLVVLFILATICYGFEKLSNRFKWIKTVGRLIGKITNVAGIILLGILFTALIVMLFMSLYQGLWGV